MKTLVLILLICTSLEVTAQHAPIPIFRTTTIPTPFITAEGNVAFTLPKGHEPVTDLTSFFRKPVLPASDAFSSGICVVRGPNTQFYWIDVSGNVVKDFGEQYVHMSTVVEGYAITVKRDNYQQIRNFVNLKGNPLHDTGFAEADLFSEGLAACKTLDGKYVYIDQTGKIAIDLFKDTKVDYADLGHFSGGRALIQTGSGNNIRYYYIDRTGKTVIDLNSFFSDRKVMSAKEFSGPMAGVMLASKEGTDGDLVFIDNTGNPRFTITNVSGFRNFVDGLAVVHSTHITPEKTIVTTSTVIDTLGNEVKLSTPKPYYHIAAVSSKFIFATAFDQTTKTYVFSRDTRSRVFETEGEFAALSGDYLLTRIGDYEYQYYIIRLPDNVVWTPDADITVFEKVSDALKVKDKVRFLQLGSAEPFTSDVYTLSKLEDLQLSYHEMTHFPAGFSKLANLERIKLFRLNKLTTLPVELAQLKKLHTLEIDNCPGLKNLELIIENCTSLKKVDTDNYSFKPGFIEKMKKQRPDLKINNVLTINLGETIIR